MKKIHRNESGAALVEFAVSAVLLFTLLFGIIEAGWALSNQLDVRHGVRQAARVAAVIGNPADDPAMDADAERDEIVRAACEAMKTPFRSGAEIDFRIVGTDVEVRIDAPSIGLTGFIPGLNSLNLRDTSTAFIEQTPEWVDAVDLTCASVGL